MDRESVYSIEWPKAALLAILWFALSKIVLTFPFDLVGAVK